MKRKKIGTGLFGFGFMLMFATASAMEVSKEVIILFVVSLAVMGSGRLMHGPIEV